MARGVNKVILIGNLGKDPESKSMPSGDAVCNFSIAVNEEWKDKQTGEKKEKAEWVNVVVFRRLAEVCGQYLKKGSKVYLEGKLRTRKWQDKDGNDRYTTEVVVDEMRMLDSRRDGEGGSYERSESSSSARAAPAASDKNFEDDDIPF